MKRFISAEDIIALEPCSDWPEKRIREFLPEPVDIISFCLDSRISSGERAWVMRRLYYWFDMSDRVLSLEILRIFRDRLGDTCEGAVISAFIEATRYGEDTPAVVSFARRIFDWHFGISALAQRLYVFNVMNQPFSTAVHYTGYCKYGEGTSDIAHSDCQALADSVSVVLRAALAAKIIEIEKEEIDNV